MTDNQPSLLSQVRPFLPRFLAALFFMAMIALFTVMLPLVIEPLINEFSNVRGGTLTEEGIKIRNFIINTLGVSDKDMLKLLPGLILFVFMGQAVFAFLALYSMKTLGLKVVRDIRDQLYRILIKQSVDFLSKARTGDLTSRISNDIEKIKFAVSETIAVYVRESLTLVALLLYIFVRDWKLSLISLVILPV
ncbi:MAG: hypothetical protein GY765_08770, partial [bacterium]|nr:hypothetical protein [bacterium]